MALLLAIATFLSTLLGGYFALKKQDSLHTILGFSAGAVVGVAFFDIMPEAIRLATPRYDISLVTAIMAIGLLSFMFLSRVLLLHPHSDHVHEGEMASGRVGAGSLAIHSFLDGVGIGLAFQISNGVGLIVAAAVLAHDFSDGINTVGFILKHKGSSKDAFRWLLLDALAPVLGVVSTRFFTLPASELGLVLALFSGFFIYIGASDLLPESHHQHPRLSTSVMTVLGALVIYGAVHLANI